MATELIFAESQFFMVFIFAIWVYITVLGYERDDSILLYIQFIAQMPLSLILFAHSYLQGQPTGYGVAFSLLVASIYFVWLGMIISKQKLKTD